MASKSFLELEKDRLPNMSKEDWILLILAGEKKDNPRDCAVLMNEVFFFLKELAPAMEEEFGFKGTGSGPFSPGVVEAVDKLVSDDFLEIKKDHNTGINYYSLTEKGNARGESLIKNLSENKQKKIRFAQFVGHRMGYLGILQYLGSVHPEYVYVRMVGDALV